MLDEGKTQGMTLENQAYLARERARVEAERPPFDPMIALVIEAWNTLGSERSIGWVVGPIPYRAVLDWCDRRPYLDAAMTDAIAVAINHLDADRNRRESAKRNSNTKQHPTSRRE